MSLDLARITLPQPHLYGLSYLVGCILLYAQLSGALSKSKTKMSQKQVGDYVAVLMIGLVVGARFTFVLASLRTPQALGGVAAEFYKEHPLEIFEFWHGGMSFYGGLIGSVIAGVIFASRNQLAKYQVADETVLWAPVPLAIGRVATFLDQNIPGRITDSPFGIQFGSLPGLRYPWHLFEALAWVILLLPVLWVVRSKSFRRPGLVFWAFIAGYGCIRLVVEFFREPGLVFLGFPVAQYVSAAMILLGGVMLFTLLRGKKGTTCSI